MANDQTKNIDQDNTNAQLLGILDGIDLEQWLKDAETHKAAMKKLLQTTNDLQVGQTALVETVAAANQTIAGLRGLVASQFVALERIELGMKTAKEQSEAGMKALFDKLSANAELVVEPVKEPGLKGWAKRWWKPVVTVLGGVAVGVGGAVAYDHLAGETVTVELPSSQPAYQ